MKRILFLTTVPDHVIEKYVAIEGWSNMILPRLLSERGASVTIKRWMDEDILASVLDHDVVTFLWAEGYIQHPTKFLEFLTQCKDKVESISTSASRPCIVNPIELVQWNMDKRYLLEMQDAGFDIPKTEIIEAQQFGHSSALHQRLREFQLVGRVVLKPAISASSTNTRLIQDISVLSAEDIVYLEMCIEGGLGSSLVVQQFEPSITEGEYSFTFVGETLTHAVLKTPCGGDFRCQSEYGGQLRHIPIDEIESPTLSIVNSIFAMLRDRFRSSSTGKMGYVRVDGLVTKDRPFIVMEIEAIEPHLYFEIGGHDEILSFFLE
ncbi:uncharacterized protein N7469_008052 [Penicillium citrinum]|uniref:Prokaryotic glutathione synthetase ATP-binding domain-containing protein n=1 Tax=Penicillium citrinum TaxID=5077 RepID=A0A9W9NR24_PENCI|nr:uncharacterized protein N7469_008052 [Penicillium citrinum]KAJ5224549.1 hypothetical protein N7469_008052 [Penicillium citrinum]